MRIDTLGFFMKSALSAMKGTANTYRLATLGSLSAKDERTMKIR
jgi:hypothetical protein